jgi:hypothetical protein
MSISFACPECAAPIEVADEHAGQSGQCPRCQRVIEIPTPTKILTSKATPAAVPARDWWEEPRPERRSRRRWSDDDDLPRRRGVALAQQGSGGPMWAWLLGIFAAVVAFGLLVASFAVLVSWRQPEPTKHKDPVLVGEVRELQKMEPQMNGPPKAPRPTVTAGRLDAMNQAFLANGVFQMRSELHPEDPMDIDHPHCRAKIVRVHLDVDKTYVVEMQSDRLDSEVRIERDQFGVKGNQEALEISRPVGNNDAMLRYRPKFAGLHQVHATTRNGIMGSFTLTIREEGRPRP